MKITNITFGRLVSTGNYENLSLRLSSELEEGDNPQEKIRELELTVNAELEARTKLADDYNQLSYELTRKRDDLNRVRDELTRMKARRDKAATFLEQHGISQPMRWEDPEEDPFADE